MTFLPFLLSRGLSTFNHILSNSKRAFLTCYLDDLAYLHGISYSVTSYDLDKFLLQTLQFHPALVAGTGAWTPPFNAAMSEHLYTSYPPYILSTVQTKIQTWTYSPAQVLIRSLLLSSSMQRKQFGMVVVRDTLKTFCFPFLLACFICSCQTVSPHIFGTKSKLRLCTKKVQLRPQKSTVCWLSMAVSIDHRLFANVVKDLLTDVRHFLARLNCGWSGWNMAEIISTVFQPHTAETNRAVEINVSTALQPHVFTLGTLGWALYFKLCVYCVLSVLVTPSCEGSR